MTRGRKKKKDMFESCHVLCIFMSPISLNFYRSIHNMGRIPIFTGELGEVQRS